jgi:mono/diheme cytochrome c family protein
VSLALVIGVQVLIVGIVLFVATPTIKRRAPAFEGWLALARTGAIVAGVILIAQPLIGTATPMSRTPNPVPSTVASVRAGAELYQATCARCHGVDARGGGPDAGTTPVQPPSLRAHLAAHTDGDIAYWIGNGLPGGMPAFEGQLSEDDRWDLVNYLRSLGQDTRTSTRGPAGASGAAALAVPVMWLGLLVAFAARAVRRGRGVSRP